MDVLTWLDDQQKPIMEKILRRCHDKKLLELQSGPRPRDNNSIIYELSNALSLKFSLPQKTSQQCISIKVH